eukprot:g8354.t1
MWSWQSSVSHSSARVVASTRGGRQLAARWPGLLLGVCGLVGMFLRVPRGASMREQCRFQAGWEQVWAKS